MDIEKLRNMDGGELDKLFIEGTLPDNLEGFYKGIALPQSSKTYVPSLFGRFFIFVGDLVWHGKTFMKVGDELRGVNIVTPYKIPLFHFKVEVQDSKLDGRPAYVLNYNIFPNPLPVRFIRDELRKIGDNLYLGLMFLSPLGRLNIPSIYFALQK